MNPMLALFDRLMSLLPLNGYKTIVAVGVRAALGAAAPMFPAVSAVAAAVNPLIDTILIPLFALHSATKASANA